MYLAPEKMEVITDTTVLSNFLLVNRLDILTEVVGNDVISRPEADYLLSGMIANGFYSPIKNSTN